MSGKPIIRAARRSDLDGMVRLLQAGAIDQAGLSIPATREKLERWMIFDDDDAAAGEPAPKPKSGRAAPFVFSFLIVSSTGELAGMAMYYYNFSTWNATPGFCLEELYVRPEYRGHGYARFLFEAMAKRAQEDGCEKISWLCLTNNERALKFYGKVGAKRIDDWCTLKLGQEGIDSLAGGGSESYILQ